MTTQTIRLNQRELHRLVELFDSFNQNQWFDVTITKLIKGGYLAVYKKEIECFIPGSHAAANVVHNFNDMLHKTLTVMVDNYDQSNDLFILVFFIRNVYCRPSIYSFFICHVFVSWTTLFFIVTPINFHV